METVFEILFGALIYIVGCGLGIYLLCLLSRLPGWNDSLGKPVIKVYYKK